MKNLLTACLPAVALLALGGCAGTSALTSSEDDGVYYSSKDRTSMVVNRAPASAPAATDEAANPDYNGTTARPNSQGTGSDQYYDNTYTYMRGVPSYTSATYYGPGINYYTPYSPYTSLNMGWGGAYGMSPFGYDPFYSSFSSPYYGYGSGLSISFGFGRPWGYGSFGGYGYNPYGFGYGGGYGGFYDPYYYNSRFYGGYYGGGGYYGNNYYGGNYGNSYYGGNDNNGRGRTSGHRTDRTSEGRSSSGMGGVSSGPTGTSGATGGGRVRSERLAPNGAGTILQSMPEGLTNTGGRMRSADEKANVKTSADMPSSQPADSYSNRPRRMDAVTQPQYRDMDPAVANPNAKPMQDQITRGDGRGRWRDADVQPQNNPGQMQPAASQPQEGRRRGGFFQNVLGEPINNAGQGKVNEAAQPRQRAYDQPRQQTYSQPRQQTYEQPRQQTYEQPRQQTYSQPSYSAPSNSGGGGGGGGRSRGRGE